MPLLGEAVSIAIRRSGLALAFRHTLGRRRVAIVVYHDPDPRTFEKHLAYLATCFHFLPLSELVNAIHARDWRRVPSQSIVITFDDGHRRNAELAPVFERYGVIPTIYICSQIVGTRRRFWFLAVSDPEPFKRVPDPVRQATLAREAGFSQTEAHDGERQALQEENIRSLAGRVDFGSHTRFHPILPQCSDADAEREIVLSKSEVERWVGSRCEHFAFPNGDYGDREIELVKKAGYRSARTTDIGWNGVSSDPFALKILSMPDDASVDRLAAEVSGVKSMLLALRRMMRGEPRRY